MNRKEKNTKPSVTKFLAGILMTAIGFSGIGYIPGKELTVTLVFAAVMVLGAAFIFTFVADVNSYNKIIEAEREAERYAALTVTEKFLSKKQLQVIKYQSTCKNRQKTVKSSRKFTVA